MKYKDLISQYGSPADFIIVNLDGSANNATVKENKTENTNRKFQQL
ncbi:MAG TPA: hypothetical protein VIS75_04185 [Chitinophagaceae bacterium]